MALTIKEVENAKPNGKPYKLADSGGLCLFVTPSGAKLWRWRYRFKGKEKTMSFGEYPVVTLKDAREPHYVVRKTLAAGLDPMAERKAKSEAEQAVIKACQREAENSFGAIARRWWSCGLSASRRGTQKPLSGGWRPMFFPPMVTSSLTR